MRQGRETAGEYTLELKPNGEFSVIHVSKDMLELHGFDESEMFGFGAWHVAVAPEDEEYVSSMVEEMLSGGGWVGRMRTRTKDGRKVILELDSRVRRDGDRILVDGLARDITAQAELEAAVHVEETKLKLLSERIPVVLWSTDRECRFTWGSGPGLEMLGLKPMELVGTTLYEYFGTDDHDFEPIRAHRDAMEKGEEVSYTIEWSGRTWRSSVEPARDELGNVSGAIAVAIDVTDTEALEAEALRVGRGVAQLAVAAAASKSEANGNPGPVAWGDLVVDVDAHRVTKDGKTVGLTPTEFKLLAALARQPDRAVDRRHLLETVWGYDFPGGESPLSMTMKRLREKIEDDPHHPTRLETVRGIGYRLNSSP